AIQQTYSLREMINSGFNQVRAFADAMWFEFGPFRQRDLVLRDRILIWQAPLRMLFIYSVSFLKYRLQLPGFELPDSVRIAQQDFAECLAGNLDGMADHLQGKATEKIERLDIALAGLKDAVGSSAPAEIQETLTTSMNAMLLLAERME